MFYSGMPNGAENLRWEDVKESTSIRLKGRKEVARLYPHRLLLFLLGRLKPWEETQQGCVAVSQVLWTGFYPLVGDRHGSSQEVT